MASITEIKGIKSNQVYECIADFTDPFNNEISFKKGDIIIGDDVQKIDETNIQFFKFFFHYFFIVFFRSNKIICPTVPFVFFSISYNYFLHIFCSF